MTGHGIFATGVDLWRTDIERFLTRWVTTRPAPMGRSGSRSVAASLEV